MIHTQRTNRPSGAWGPAPRGNINDSSVSADSRSPSILVAPDEEHKETAWGQYTSTRATSSEGDTAEELARSGYEGDTGITFLLHWIRSGLLAALIFCPTGLLGVFGDDRWEMSQKEMWCAAFLPGAAWYVAAVIGLGGRLAEKIGSDMIEERSPGISLRESLRATLTNTGVVSALFLTINLAMAQIDRFDDDQLTLRSLWYIMYSVMAVANCLEAVIMCSVTMLYLEPLCDNAAEIFLHDNMLYAGEPMTRMAMGILHMLLAMILWVYGQYGLSSGIYVLITCWYVTTRLLVCHANLSRWENVTIPDAERSRKKTFRDWKYLAWFCAGTKSIVAPVTVKN